MSQGSQDLPVPLKRIDEMFKPIGPEGLPIHQFRSKVLCSDGRHAGSIWPPCLLIFLHVLTAKWKAQVSATWFFALNNGHM